MSFVATPQLIMRAAAASIYFFDYVMTLPSEYQVYQRQRQFWKPSPACILSVLVRYATLIAIVMATAFFFGTHWTEKTCVPAVGGALRAFSASIVSLIFLWRTWAIWHKSRAILYFLMVALIPTTVFKCTGVFGAKQTSCVSLILNKHPVPMAAPVFDALSCGLSTYRLILNLRNGTSGLGDFFISVGLQVLNLIFLLSPNAAKQNTMITFTNAITGLLAQRVAQDTSRTRDRSLSLLRWANALLRPGLSATGFAKSDSIELSQVMSVQVRQEKITDADAYPDDAESAAAYSNMKGGSKV
ncbi:hypothetical protein B0H11DRAFT_1994886 [Mycena galericulata]|nr:hypothetical protein B0H11DRAFT_1994886 [Mycena galericulata]